MELCPCVYQCSVLVLIQNNLSSSSKILFTLIHSLWKDENQKSREIIVSTEIRMLTHNLTEMMLSPSPQRLSQSFYGCEHF